MPEQFLHGVEVVEIDSGPRPIRTVRSSVILMQTKTCSLTTLPYSLRANAAKRRALEQMVPCLQPLTISSIRLVP